MRNTKLLVIAGIAIVTAAVVVACGGSSTTGKPVGSACTTASDCASPPTAACLTEYRPLTGLLKTGTDPNTVASFDAIGLAFPGGYCTNAGNCATDADCPTGGTCFIGLAGVPQTTLNGLAPTVPFDINTFATKGLCLEPCTPTTVCRTGYVCDWPLSSLISLVPGVQKKTYCIATPSPCLPNPCANGGTCTVSGTSYTCACTAGFSGSNCGTSATGLDAGTAGLDASTPGVDASTGNADTGVKPAVDAGPTPADAGPADASPTGCGTSQLITYSLTGNFKLIDTPAGMADGTWTLPGTAAASGTSPLTTPPAQMVLRVDANGTHVSVVSFNMLENVQQSPTSMNIYTNIASGFATNTCGSGTGTLSGTTLTWSACTTPADYGTKGWQVSELLTGPGCVGSDSSGAPAWGNTGSIYCGAGALCTSLANLNQGANPVTPAQGTWRLKLSNFVFADATLGSFTADYFQLPNSNGALATMSLVGTKVSSTADTTPACACP